MKRLRTLFRVVKGEGAKAAVNRALDGWDERRRLRQLIKITPSEIQQAPPFPPPPIINFSVLPPAPNRGGSQLQMLDRLRWERLHRTIALLFPLATHWRLEISAEERVWILDGPKSDPSHQNLNHVVGWARRSLRTKALHIENLAGLPLNQIPELAETGPIIIGVHDFTGYCRRPHLMERPGAGFCNYSSDPNRCHACLSHDWQVPSDAAEAHRNLARKALKAAQTIIFPSRFLQERYSEFFNDIEVPSRVIEPATTIQLPPMTHRRHPPHVAFVGGIKEHKGGSLVVQTAEILRRRQPALLMTAYGDGDPHLIREIKRAARVRVHGFYRRGELPILLLRNQVDVAILPSIWPETYGLVVDVRRELDGRAEAGTEVRTGHRVDIPIRARAGGRVVVESDVKPATTEIKIRPCLRGVVEFIRIAAVAADDCGLVLEARAPVREPLG